uniref:Uncharacterized protein n=1 Tax=Aegilops tauschii subsp. strangulata TaxID=200361 RepID=A0A453QGF6_AEGTS
HQLPPTRSLPSLLRGASPSDEISPAASEPRRSPPAMATRNRTPLFRKYRDALRHVRAPAGAPSASSSSSSPGGGPAVVEMASLLRPDRNYAPLSTDDPSASSRSPAPPPLPLASRPASPH